MRLCVNNISVEQALKNAAAAGMTRLDGQQLLAHLMGCGRTWLLAHNDAALTDAQNTTWGQWLARAAQGEPLAYLLGEKEFHGLRLTVTPDVLIPRADTETLVDWALQRLKNLQSTPNSPTSAPSVIDLGCGSGAIALAIKHRFSAAEVTALDASPAALAVAQANGARLNLAVEWLHSDWWAAVPGQRFHLAVSNPPYIAEGDSHLPALQHEPEQALTSGPEGLDALQHIIDTAPEHLHPGAWLLLEHGASQGSAVRALLIERGFSDVSSHCDLAGHERCSGGCWPHSGVQ
jgi:release factor glutamine methyltransferase